MCGGAEIHLVDRSNYDSVTVALHMIKAYLYAIKDGSMKINSGIDKMFGVLGLFQTIQTKPVSTILKGCEADRKLYLEQIKQIYIYD